MGLFSKKNSGGEKISAAAVQTGSCARHPFGRVSLYTPLGTNGHVYASLRESVPIIDAAVLKIIRLVNDFKFETGDEAVDRDLNGFFENINVGGNQIGIDTFVSSYLSDLLTYGSAVGEMIADDNGFYALYNGELATLEVKRAENGFDIEFYNGSEKIARQDLILFTALNPKPGEITGTSLLSGLPFIADICLRFITPLAKIGSTPGICGMP